MTRRGRSLAGGALLTVALSLLLAVWGCSSLTENSPTGTGSSYDDSRTGGSTVPGETAKALISAESGGSLVLGPNTLVFPPHALDQDTWVSISRVGYSTTFVMSPHGLQFNRPVELTLEMANDITGSQQRTFTVNVIYYLDEFTGEWVNIGGIPNTSDHSITAPIMHFSRYGTGTPWLL